VADHLVKSPGGSLQVTLELNAGSQGFLEDIVRVARDNADQLGAKAQKLEPWPPSAEPSGPMPTQANGEGASGHAEGNQTIILGRARRGPIRRLLG